MQKHSVFDDLRFGQDDMADTGILFCREGYVGIVKRRAMYSVDMFSLSLSVCRKNVPPTHSFDSDISQCFSSLHTLVCLSHTLRLAPSIPD